MSRLALLLLMRMLSATSVALHLRTVHLCAATSIWAFGNCMRSSQTPILFTHQSTMESLAIVNNYVAKLNADDEERTIKVRDHYAQHIDIEKLFTAATRK